MSNLVCVDTDTLVSMGSGVQSCIPSFLHVTSQLALARASRLCSNAVRKMTAWRTLFVLLVASRAYADRGERTPLHAAAVSGDAKAVKVLVDAGAALEAQDHRKRRPLHWAAYKGHTEATTVLCEAGASLEAADDYKKTPLHLAAEQGHAEAAKVLVKAGAPLEAQTNNKATPLHYAAEKGHTEAVKALVEAGASLEAQADGKRTPLDVAINEQTRQTLADAQKAREALRSFGVSSGLHTLLSELKIVEALPAAAAWFEKKRAEGFSILSIGDVIALELENELFVALDLKRGPARKLTTALLKMRDAMKEEL